MSDDPNKRGAADRSRVALGEEHEVRYFVETMQKQFPKSSSAEIEAALEKARAAGGSASREDLTQRVAAILGRA